jgi:hypothetical protein
MIVKAAMEAMGNTASRGSKTQDELQWIVAQRLLSAVAIPGLNQIVCKRFTSSIV